MTYTGKVTIILTVAFVTGIAGAMISIILGKCVRGTKTPLVIGQLLMGISIAVCPSVINTPAHGTSNLPMFFGAFWGIVLGFNAAWDEPYYTALIPGGREAEMFGLHIFSASLLEWLPPIIFSICDTALPHGQKTGLQILSCFYFLGTLILFTVRTSEGKGHSSGTMHLRRLFGAVSPEDPPAPGKVQRMYPPNKLLSMIPESPMGVTPVSATSVANIDFHQESPTASTAGREEEGGEED